MQGLSDTVLRMTILSISEAASHVGLSIDTLRRWDKKGLLRAQRDSRGVRHFRLEEVQALVDKERCRAQPQAKRALKALRAAENGLSSIDLFAGAGGTALGLENAGFQHELLSELDPNAVATLRGNRPDWNVESGDVAALDFHRFRNKIDLVEGGFPCQSFSYAGRSRGFADTRGTLFFEFARSIMEVMPRAFIGENVKGLLNHDKGRTLHTMLETLRSIKDPETGTGYRIAFKVVRSQYLDVPQKRERLILLGVREDVGTEVFFPKERDYIVTLWDAIGDRPQAPGQEYSPNKAAVLSQIPQGGYWKDLPEAVQRAYLGGSFHLSGGKTGMARRLAWDEPSLTLTCSPAQKQTERCHPDETRPLNTREYARIQTFPDAWQFAGGLGAIYKQIGNAVPVNLGFYLGKCAEAMIAGGLTASTQEYVESAAPETYVS